MILFGLMAVSRTSMFGDDEKPCDEAEIVPFVRVDRRNIDDPLKIICRACFGPGAGCIGNAWYDLGRNHRVENGCIARDFDDERWMVWIADADDLQAFVKKYGEIILSINTDGIEPCYAIEIYDTYRE